MANFLAELYQSSALMPLDKVIAALSVEIDPKRLSDFAKRVEAIKKIDDQNTERKLYWEALAIWSTRRLGDAISELPKRQPGKKPGKTKGSELGDTMSPNSLAAAGITKKAAQRAKKLAAVPAAAIEAYIVEQRANGQEISKAGAMRAAAPKREKPKAEEPPFDPEPTKTEGPVKDQLGLPIPAKCVEAFYDATAFDDCIKTINSLIRDIEELASKDAGAFVHSQSITGELKSAKNGLKFARPHQGTCGYCKTSGRKCDACKGRGWLPRSLYESLPAEKK